ncbi:MAG TPA: hypothetical protein VHX49_00760 [Candidatus Acidoferrales bacterium]|nr:hypothetical protein [Candidatus Acidoferrales bacterium]
MEQVEIVEKIVGANDAAATEWSERSSTRVEVWAEKRSSIADLIVALGRNTWAWLHLLSLDAPLVAVLWQLLFAKALHAPLPPVVTLVTALVIWLIYVADRILDSYQPEETEGEALRHQFYRAHRLAFLPVFLIVLLVTGWMSYANLGFKTWRDGLLLAGIVGGYFAIVHLLGGRAQKWFPKEIAVAILFGIGTFMPVSVRAQDLHFRFLLPFLLFLLVLWMNTLLIEYAEWVTLRGRRAARPHQSTILVGQHLAVFGVSVGILALCAMASRWFPQTRPILLAEALSALALALLAWKWRRISSYAVRVIADVVLLTPLFLLVFLRR